MQNFEKGNLDFQKILSVLLMSVSKEVNNYLKKTHFS